MSLSGSFVISGVLVLISNHKIWNQGQSLSGTAEWGRCKSYAAIGTEEAMDLEIQALTGLVQVLKCFWNTDVRLNLGRFVTFGLFPFQPQFATSAKSDVHVGRPHHHINDTSMIPTLCPITRRDADRTLSQLRILLNQIIRLATLLEGNGQLKDAIMHSEAGLDRLVFYMESRRHRTDSMPRRATCYFFALNCAVHAISPPFQTTVQARSARWIIVHLWIPVAA